MLKQVLYNNHSLYRTIKNHLNMNKKHKILIKKICNKVAQISLIYLCFHFAYKLYIVGFHWIAFIIISFGLFVLLCNMLLLFRTTIIKKNTIKKILNISVNIGLILLFVCGIYYESDNYLLVCASIFCILILIIGTMLAYLKKK